MMFGFWLGGRSSFGFGLVSKGSKDCSFSRHPPFENIKTRLFCSYALNSRE